MLGSQYILLMIATLIFCHHFADAAQLTVTLQSKQGEVQSLPGAVIYALPVDIQFPATTVTTTIEQKNRQFSPYISIIQRGTRVKLPNMDLVSHHVYSFSEAKRFELPLYRQQQPGPIVFDKTGVVILGCNIHDWMLAYIVVVDTPYFSTFSAHSSQLELPVGRYQLNIWHPQLDTQESTTLLIDIEATDNHHVWHLQYPLTANQQPQEPDDFGEAGY